LLSPPVNFLTAAAASAAANPGTEGKQARNMLDDHQERDPDLLDLKL
jgi:hypothetical protein